MVFSLHFIGLSLPKPTSGSPGPSNNFRVKELALLGELMTLGVSLSSPGQVTSPQSDPFSYKQAC